MTDNDEMMEDKNDEMPMEEGHWGDLENQVKMEWDNTAGWTKEKWDDAVDKLVEGYEGAMNWTEEEMAKAKATFKGRYDQYMMDKEKM